MGLRAEVERTDAKNALTRTGLGVSDRRAQCSEDQGIGGNEGTGGNGATRGF
jgi:hypothetical protein